MRAALWSVSPICLCLPPSAQSARARELTVGIRFASDIIPGREAPEGLCAEKRQPIRGAARGTGRATQTAEEQRNIRALSAEDDTTKARHPAVRDPHRDDCAARAPRVGEKGLKVHDVGKNLDGYMGARACKRSRGAARYTAASWACSFPRFVALLAHTPFPSPVCASRTIPPI